MNYSDVQNFVSANPTAVQQGQEILQQILVRSATDMDFRARLLEAPAEAVREVAGNDYAGSTNVRFVENTADATFVLPDPIDPTHELDEAELEAVAGGISTLSTWEYAAIFGAIALTANIANQIASGQ